MKRANLLPNDLRRRSRRRLLRDRFTCAIAATGCIAVAWASLAVIQISSLSSQQLEVESIVTRLSAELQEVALLEATCDRMQAEIESIESLRAPIPMTGVLALLSRSAPDTITFEKLIVELTHDKRAVTARLNNRGTAPLPGDIVRIHVSGAATSDASVVSYIGQLSGDPRIRNVRSAPSITSANEQQRGTEHQFAIIFELVRPQLAASVVDEKGAL